MSQLLLSNMMMKEAIRPCSLYNWLEHTGTRHTQGKKEATPTTHFLTRQREVGETNEEE